MRGKSLHYKVLLVFAFVLIVAGVLGFILPAQKGLTSAAPAYNIFHIVFGSLGLFLILIRNEDFIRAFNIGFGLIDLYQALASFLHLFPVKYFRWTSTDNALHLKRKPKEPALAYQREDVTFKNGAVTLSGTLVKPLTKGPFPALVIVHGSGPQGRPDSSYRFWGNFFAQHGVAARMYDKRGAGQSTGNYEQASFDDLAGDALAAVELLRK